MTQDPVAYLADCVKIESFALEEEFIRLPADLAYWNDQYSQAYKRYLQAKTSLESLVANLSMLCRDQLTAQAKGRVTVAEVEQLLLTTDQYQQAKQIEIDAECEKVRLYGVLDALRTKKDMLVSLGAHIRAEMGNDPSIRKQSYIEREVAANKAARGG
jgi:hypothetical protein